ncbi:bifunctional AP-4-A phosphorylase/ADP sulfurylase [Quaeritorhiza haematococci]|nr:bifunctional AP-4-A phosphorylase/ADP sulfurylase [Quaeritorhiza haematococci]
MPSFGTLTTKIRSVFDKGLHSGHLIFTESTVDYIEDAGVKFQIRFAPSLAKKPQGFPATHGVARAPAQSTALTATHPDTKPTTRPNPFLPPDPHLFVEAFQNHNCVLNKFSVVRYHSLITTKDFESQLDPPNARDFEAAWHFLTSDGMPSYLGFYNCGPLSGASVPHKHLQMVPIDDGTDEYPMPPIAALLRKNNRRPGEMFTIDEIPFVHGFVTYDTSFLMSGTENTNNHQNASDAVVAGSTLEALFRKLVTFTMPQCNIDPQKALSIPTTQELKNTTSGGTKEEGRPSYNLLFTARWMLVVPRRQEKSCPLIVNDTRSVSVSVNSLGFAGMLLAKSEEEVEFLKKLGPMKVLRDVAFTKSS